MGLTTLSMFVVRSSLTRAARRTGRRGLLAYAHDCSQLNTGEDDQPSTSGRALCTAAAGDADTIRTQLLELALKHVRDRGWTSAALTAAARDMQLSPAVAGILSRGEGELVEYFIERCNRQCVEELEARRHELQGLPLEERISRALQLRLEMLAPHIDTWPQAVAVAARPSGAPHGVRLLFSLVDDVWAAVGDQSTDLTWYSKRALLAGAYKSTSLYMMTDYSPGFRDTWAALRRRVAEALALDASLAGLVHAASAARMGAPPGFAAAEAAAAEAEAEAEAEAGESAGEPRASEGSANVAGGPAAPASGAAAAAGATATPGEPQGGR